MHAVRGEPRRVAQKRRAIFALAILTAVFALAILTADVLLTHNAAAAPCDSAPAERQGLVAVRRDETAAAAQRRHRGGGGQ